MLTLKQIEALYWIARLGSFDAAAQRLHTSQAAISKRVHELESAFETPLLDRAHRGARLTVKGEDLLLRGKEMLKLRDQIIEEMSDKEALVRRFHFGVTELTALTWLPRLVQEIRAAYPKVILEPVVDSSAKLYKRLCDDTIDFIIVPEALHDSRFATVTLNHVQTDWMCSPELLNNNRVVPLARIADHTLLAQDELSFTGAIVNTWLDAKGVKVGRRLSSNSVVALGGLAVAGLGITYLPRYYFDDLVRAGWLQVLRTSPRLPDVPYAAMYRHDGPATLNGSVCEMAKKCCDFCNPFGRNQKARPGVRRGRLVRSA